MNHETRVAILRKLLALTENGELQWIQGEDQFFSTTILGETIAFRFLYLAPMILDDDEESGWLEPLLIEIGLPGLAGFFACGTEGYNVCLEILGHAFAEYRHPKQASVEKFVDQLMML